MVDIEEKKIELTPAEDNLWYKFMVKSLELDKYAQPIKPYGWHWFWGIYEVYKDSPEFLTGYPMINLDEIKESIPKSHWLNNPTPSTGMGKPDKSLKEESVFILKSLLKKHNYSDLPQEIDFTKLLFKHSIDFSNFIFPIMAGFAYSEFSNYVEFKKIYFCRSVDFIFTKFYGGSDFNNAKFLSNVTFDGADFAKAANFRNATFADNANFSGAVFSKNASFTEATFLRLSDFNDTKFHNFSYFSKVAFSGGADFSDATFSRLAMFDQITITGYTSFRGAEFVEEAPSFHKADLYSDIIWDESRWPALNKKSHLATVYQNKNAYENLASNMKKLDKYHDEHFFYRKEMQCRGWLASYQTKFFYWLYEKLADYGYGVEPAFKYWRWHMYVGAGIIAILSLRNSCLEYWKGGTWETAKSMLCSIPVSFSNAHGFLPFHNGPLKGCYDYFAKDDIFNAIWVIQTLAGIPLLFLVLLTLRIRFRLK